MPREPTKPKQKKYGNWTFLRISDKKGTQGQTLWVCRCKCGFVKDDVSPFNLINETSKGCRKCLHNRKPETKHPLYPVWRNRIKKDCIPEWKDFKTFAKQAPKKTARFLLKTDDTKPFGPDNCVWQPSPAKNKTWKGTPKKFQTVCGIAKGYAEWGRLLGLSRERIRTLIKDYGSLEDALQRRAEIGKFDLSELLQKDQKVIAETIAKYRPVGNLGSEKGGYKYPWEDWTNGEVWKIDPKAYNASKKHMQSIIHSYASNRNLGCVTRTDPENPELLLIQLEGNDLKSINTCGRPEKYPWKEWADGKWHHIRQGEDFLCDVEAVRASLFGYVRRNSLEVKTQVPINDLQSVIFQFSKNGKVK